ncbi:MAG: F0F1 ATP synthase subunit epsilon [Acidimicrobiales bacterium]
MADGFALAVVTPGRLLVDADAQALVVRTTEGDMTVLDGHTSLVATLVPWVVRVDPVEGEPVRLAVHGGFLQVDTGPQEDGDPPGAAGTRVTLLAGIAELAEEIDVERARRAKEAAESKVGEGRAEQSDEESEEYAETRRAAEELARAEIRLEAAGAAS